MGQTQGKWDQFNLGNMIGMDELDRRVRFCDSKPRHKFTPDSHPISLLGGVRFPGLCLFSCRFLSWDPLAVILLLRDPGENAVRP
eukprot:g28938.t1